ncbi:MAG: hypothetical protein JW725_02145 [Candidatus Babeliaceae bacterium]|nr:hypothetical protein [Candidatus Babeliaceae bacterium]
MERDKELYERQVKIVDKQIDKLVYALYGLTEERDEALFLRRTLPCHQNGNACNSKDSRRLRTIAVRPHTGVAKNPSR